MTQQRAIETVYNGYRFRSRLEARWAVFFDRANIRYEYEPEGFEVKYSDDTYRYLPDFYFPDWDIYGEVKPSLEKLKEDEEKLAAMIDYGGPMAKGLLILGQIPRDTTAVPTLFILMNEHKSIARRACTFLQKPRSWINIKPKTQLLIDDFDAENSGWPDLPIRNMPQELFSDFDLITKKVTVGDITLQACVELPGGKYVPHKAYETAAQARFEYGETPSV